MKVEVGPARRVGKTLMCAYGRDWKCVRTRTNSYNDLSVVLFSNQSGDKFHIAQHANAPQDGVRTIIATFLICLALTSLYIVARNHLHLLLVVLQYIVAH
jgi:hypothetical protein